MVERPFIERNAVERARLEALVARLSNDDLARTLDGGWTVAAKLAHLAFWEQRALVLLAKWQREGAVRPSPVDEDVVNDALLPQWLALPPRGVIEHLVEVSRAVDAMLESVGDEMIAGIHAAREPIEVFRANHRGEHLDEIERALSLPEAERSNGA